jgi:deoxyadenosine/deoxycytidine kinase
MKPIIGIEGIIGCGKTTLAKELAKRLNYRLLEEPVESNHYLPLFYKEPKKYAFAMQIELLYRRYVMHQLACYESLNTDSPYDGIIMDRTLQGDWVFAQLHTEAGNIMPIMMETYNKTCDIMSAHMKEPMMIIYLDVNPEIALQRVMQRNRKSELETHVVSYNEYMDDFVKKPLLNIEYLIKLQSTYELMITQIQKKTHRWSYGVKTINTIKWDSDITEGGIKHVVETVLSRA